MAEGFRAGTLRAKLAADGLFFNSGQFDEFERAGLIARAKGSNLWSHETRERLIHIHEAGKHVRGIARRVVWLRFHDHLFADISDEKLREAIIAIIPTIRAPDRSMLALHRALEKASDARQPDTGPDRAVAASGWRPPPARGWSIILQNVSDLFFHNVTDACDKDARALADILGPLMPAQVARLAYEDRLTLLAVRAIALSFYGFQVDSPALAVALGQQ